VIIEPLMPEFFMIRRQQLVDFSRVETANAADAGSHHRASTRGLARCADGDAAQQWRIPQAHHVKREVTIDTRQTME
jgi:hypothetical protein